MASLFWLAIITFVIGFLMLLFPGWVLRTSERVNVWVETSSWFRKLDEQKSFERLFYRHHIIMGLAIVLGSLYSLWFLWGLQERGLTLLLPAIENRILKEILEACLLILLQLGNLLAFLVGMVVVVRPSLLKTVENWSNRWVDTDSTIKTLDSRLDLTEKMTPYQMRLFGLLVVIGSLFIMSNTWLMAF
jgi:hypothetical protein